MLESGPTLLGTCWLAAFGMWPLIKNIHLKDTRVIDCANIETNKVDKMCANFKIKFPRLLGPGSGVYNGKMLELKLKNVTNPQALKARSIPFALRGKVKEEIDRLVSLEHLERVENSEWATSIVPAIKANGSVRICGNFKLTVNLGLITNRHPLPLINDILAALGNSERFSQIDLSHAYMQICKRKFEKSLNNNNA